MRTSTNRARDANDAAWRRHIRAVELRRSTGVGTWRCSRDGSGSSSRSLILHCRLLAYVYAIQKHADLRGIRSGLPESPEPGRLRPRGSADLRTGTGHPNPGRHRSPAGDRRARRRQGELQRDCEDFLGTVVRCLERRRRSPHVPGARRECRSGHGPRERVRAGVHPFRRELDTKASGGSVAGVGRAARGARGERRARQLGSVRLPWRRSSSSSSRHRCCKSRTRCS